MNIIKTLQQWLCGDLLAKIDELKVKEEPLAKIWNDKYPKTTLSWNARSLPFSTTKIKVPLTTLITKSDGTILKDLADWGIDSDKESFETLVPKIYNKIRTEYYHYARDVNVWGNNEVFEFPFEMKAKAALEGKDMAFDCDSWAIFQVSYYLAAGLPSWRVRVVGGKCKGINGGHATVAVYSLKTKQWYHMNSTYGKSFDTISTYPSINDKTDKIGIGTVWFSFNDEYSWAKFDEVLPEGISK